MTRRALCLALLLLLLAFACRAARAHDVWANNVPVPSWVKAMCCGPDDIHVDAAIHRRGGEIYVDDVETPVDPDRVFDSKDGRVWAFYDPSQGRSAYVYCLFEPPTN